MTATQELVTQVSPDPLQHEEFWTARESTFRIRRYAHAQGAAPSGVLTFAILRALASTPHNVMLPATVGTPASLNLFAAMVGRSGGGKGIARGVAKRAVIVPGAFGELPLGSGEGLVRAFARNQEVDLGDGRKTMELDWKNRSLAFKNDEVSGLEALFGRTGATLGAQLKQAAMGETLGFAYADDSKAVILPEHSYRLTLDVAVQPELSGAMFKDSHGGFPQRFIWNRVTDPSMVPPKDRPVAPEPWIMHPHDWGTADVILDIPQVASEEILQSNYQRMIEAPSDLDGHALLVQLKAAAGFALLDNRYAVTVEDWDMAGCLMDHSRLVRAECMQAVEGEAVRQAAKRGTLQAVTREAVADAEAENEVRREHETKDLILKHWTQQGKPYRWAPIRRALGKPRRELADRIAMDLAQKIPGFPPSDLDAWP